MIRIPTTKNARVTSSLTALAMRHYLWLAVLYILLIFILPASSATMRIYNFSAFEYHIVTLLVALPTMAVWLAAFVGYSQLRGYARAIRKTPEGIYFDQLAEGCTWLAWSLPVGTIVPFVLNALAEGHPGLHAGSIIISNYISLLLPLIAFSIVANASRGLINTVKGRLTLANVRILVVSFLLMGVLYCFLTFRHFDLSSLGSSHNPYFLPIWLMVLTVTVPYLYTWFIGILATFELIIFRRHVHGVLYKQPLGLLVGGLLTVILSSVALQYITSAEPRTGYLVLNYKLAVTLLFRIIGGVGFALIALGASRLQKIEDV